MESPRPGLIALSFLLVSCGTSDPPGWSKIKADIGKRWPEVRQLQTSELAEMLASGKRVLIIDVRDPAEYEVSRLPGARNVPVGSALPEDLGSLQDYDMIVFYCSVGYRSSKSAAEMGPLPDKSVYNLEGSIFKWANEGRPIENESGPAETVHPYDESWGRLLDPRYRAPL